MVESVGNVVLLPDIEFLGLSLSAHSEVEKLAGSFTPAS